MRFQPVLAPTAVCNEGNGEGISSLHLFHHNLFYLRMFIGQHTEVQFIVHLKNHFRVDSLTFETLVDANHRHFDDVCCTALYRSVDGITLGKTANGGIVTVDVGQIATPMENSLGITAHSGRLFRPLHIVAHTRIRLEITVY